MALKNSTSKYLELEKYERREARKKFFRDIYRWLDRHFPDIVLAGIIIAISFVMGIVVHSLIGAVQNMTGWRLIALTNDVLSEPWWVLVIYTIVGFFIIGVVIFVIYFITDSENPVQKALKVKRLAKQSAKVAKQQAQDKLIAEQRAARASERAAQN